MIQKVKSLINKTGHMNPVRMIFELPVAQIMYAPDNQHFQ